MTAMIMNGLSLLYNRLYQDSALWLLANYGKQNPFSTLVLCCEDAAEHHVYAKTGGQ